MKRRTTKIQFERNSSPPAAPRLITNGAEVTDDAVWVWLKIPGGSTFLLEEDELTNATLETSQSLHTLLPAGAEYHIKVMWSRHSDQQYRESWTEFETVRAPGADEYIELGAQRIATNTREGHFRRRVVLLGLRWPDGSSDSTVERASRVARRNLRATSSAKDAHERLAAVQPKIDRWIASMNRSPLAAVPAAAGLIAWSYAREIRRVSVDAPAEDSLGGPVLVDLMSGTMDPTHSPHYVVVTDGKTGIQTFVSVLVPAVNGFPVDELTIPGGEWLEILTELPGVEASVRGVNHGLRGSIELIDQGRKLTRSQAKEAGSHGAQVPAEITAADETLNIRRQEVQRRLDVLTTNHARWVVSAPDPDQLAAKVDEVQQLYSGLVKLEVAPYVQGLLWQELLPGDRVRVPEFGQDQPMRTLAGSWFHGGSAVGDETGPYIAGNLGSTPGPVQVHVVSRADRDRRLPTTISFTGKSGSGKSTAVMLTVLGALSEGAWALLNDPKGDLAGIVPVAADLLGVPVQVVDVVSESASGIMDPMRFCPTVDEARSQTLDAMLGPLSLDDRRMSEHILEGAIDAVLREPRDAWSAQAVIARLLTTPETAPDGPQARKIGEILTLRARQPHMRAVLGPLSADARPLMTGRGLVYLSMAGLDLPRHNPDPASWTVGERCSIATFRVSLNFALQQSRHDALKKMIALTELHLITGYPEGRQFVEWVARTGRALQLWQLLDTQAAADLSGLTSLVEQLVMSFAFQATGRAEQDAQAVLLGRPDPGPRLRNAQASLDVGQCVFRDRYGRLSVIEFDRLAEWIVDAISTDVGEDSEEVSGGFGPVTTNGAASNGFSSAGASAPVGEHNGEVAATATGTEQR